LVIPPLVPDLPMEAVVGRALPILVGGVVAVGVLLRLRQYAGGRSLRLDALRVALNRATRSFTARASRGSQWQTLPPRREPRVPVAA
jgi:hypothetical protein